MNTTLPTDSKERKGIPMLGGCLRYFPAALAGVAKISEAGNRKHNPGEPLHHARGKSMDHGDCIIRHLMDIQDLVAAIERSAQIVGEAHVHAILEEAGQLCWRALALSQELNERFYNVPLAPGAKLPELGAIVSVHPDQFKSFNAPHELVVCTCDLFGLPPCRVHSIP